MCNRVHKGTKFHAFRKVKPTGTAWKLFSVNPFNDRLIPLMEMFRGYEDDDFKEIDITVPGTVVKWKNYYGKDRGFCFFTDKKAAVSVIPSFGDSATVIKKVKYAKPLGSFYSCEVNGQRQRVLIAHEFELV